MPIIISSNGEKAVKVDKTSIDKEEYLQKYIYENPESIPLYEIKEDIQLLILAREFPTNSGPIDAIGIDVYGDLYIVETKLFSNADKRKVLAQSLDYGAALWKHANDFSSFLATLDTHCQSVFQKRTSEKIQEFFGVDEEEVKSILEKTRDNLNDGKFHFVVLMDTIDDRLKDLIMYVNQNSQFDIYAVEFEYYKHNEHEIVIPRIFGTEVKKDIAVASNSTQRKRWNEELLFKDAKEKLSKEELQAFTGIYKFSKEGANKINFGTGSYGSFSPIFESIAPVSLFTITTDTRWSLNFDWVTKYNEDLVEVYKNKLEAIGFTIPENYKNIRPSVDAKEWVDKVDSFCTIIKELQSEKW